MSIEEILKYLPHRYPFLLIDRVVSCEDKNIVCLKNISINEPYFQGHFPGHPVMPGVMIIEALAQAAGILSFLTMQKGDMENLRYYFVGIDRARFKKLVVPGDQMILDVTMTRAMRGIALFDAVATVGQDVAAEAQLMCTLKEK
jgi:3-hydroxyacyl-[acyl-carrier-protein] dehydratase